MLKGIAKAGDNDPSEDRYGIVVALSNLSKTLSDAEADSPFAVAAETAAALVRVPIALVFVKSAGGELVVGGEVGTEGDPNLAAVGREVSQEAILSSNPVIYPNVSARKSGATRNLSAGSVASVICVPMRVEETTVGALVAMSAHLRAFSPSDIEILHVVASRAALAAWRSNSPLHSPGVDLQGQDELIRLAQRKIQDLALVNQVSEAVNSTLNLDELLEIALRESMTVVGADAGSLMLISEETGKLEIVASRGLSGEWVQSTSQDV